MIKSKNEFIARHLAEIQAAEPLIAREKFNDLLAVVLTEGEYKKASSFYQRTDSISQTLAECKLSPLAPELLSKLIEIEKNYQLKVPLTSMSKLSSMSEQVFSLMKMRLSAGLTYALALTAIATLIFYIISSKVLSQFKSIFESFGAELPTLTSMAISWHESYIPPIFFVLSLLVFIAFTLFQIKDIQLRRPKAILRKLPFINRIFDFIDSFTYLSELKLLACAGMPLSQIKDAGFQPPASLSKIRQYAQKEIEMAENINRLEAEIDYQLETLALKAENIVISSTRNLIGAVMTLVIIFVGFVLIASYLPIFQLGSTI